MKVLNANALSSSYIIGIPAMSAWLGAVRALERRVQTVPDLQNVQLPEMGVVFHHYKLHVYPSFSDRMRQYSIIGIGKPLVPKSTKNTLEFKRASRIDEPRIDLEVSLLIKVEGVNGDTQADFETVAKECLESLKMAGGDIISTEEVKCINPQEDNVKSVKKNLSKLMPGYAIVSRYDLLEKEMKEVPDALDALLAFLKIHHTPVKAEDGKITDWTSSKKEAGWLVPIAVGFKGISSIGHVKNQRDRSKPHQFVESLVTLGQFIMPIRFHSISDMMWHYEYVPEKDLYLCKNDYAKGGYENV